MMGFIKHIGRICIVMFLAPGLVYAVEQKDPVAAIVNGDGILMSDLNREMQKELTANPEIRASEDVAARRELRKKALDYLIDQEIIIQEGKKANLESQDAQIDGEYSKIRQRFPSESAFQQTMKQQNMTGEKLREIIKRAFMVKNVLEKKIKPIAKTVTDKDVSDYYEANKKEFVEPEEISARHILMKLSSEASDEEKTYAKKELQAILEEARSGADFAKLAKENSQGPSAINGGNLGYFARGDMVKPFEDAAFALKQGQISDIVETEYGYHIILLEDRTPEKHLRLEEVSEQIKKDLQDKEMDAALQTWLKPLREKAAIKIML